MGKSMNDVVADGMLDVIATATTLTVCSAEPTTYAEATSTYKLADVTVTPGDGNGDFTIANGDSGGRKVTISEQADIAIDSDGDATHVALSTGSVLLYVTTATTQTLTTGNTVTVPAWKITIADPV